MVPKGETIAPPQERIESTPLPKKSPIDKWESRLSPQRAAIISLDFAPALELSPQVTTAAEVGGKARPSHQTPL